MVKKVLKAQFPEKCIGCELCVFAAQRQEGKSGSTNSKIRIFNKDRSFNVHLDPQVNELDIKKIAEICPKGVFIVEEVAEDETIDFITEEDESIKG